MFDLFFIFKNAGRLKGWNRVGGSSLTIGGPSHYLPHSPEELFRRGFYKNNVNLIAGVVKNEGSFLMKSATIFIC